MNGPCDGSGWHKNPENDYGWFLCDGCEKCGKPSAAERWLARGGLKVEQDDGSMKTIRSMQELEQPKPKLKIQLAPLPRTITLPPLPRQKGR